MPLAVHRSDPPNNLEAEKELLSGIVEANDQFDEVASTLAGADFYRSSHGKIFEAMRELRARREPIDMVTLRDELTKRGFFSSLGSEEEVLSSLAIGPAVLHNLARYAKIIRDKSVLREVACAAMAIYREAMSGEMDAETLLARADERFIAIRERTTTPGEMRPFRVVLTDSIKQMEQRRDRFEKGETVMGIPSGLERYDQLTGGLQPGDLVILGARPSMGKTAACLQMAIYPAMKHLMPSGKKCAVAIFSLEQPSVQLGDRAFANEARVSLANIRNGTIDDSYFSKIGNAGARLVTSVISICDESRMTTADIRAKTRRWARSLEGTDAELGFVVIDYLQLIRTTERAENENLRIAGITKELKAIAKELNVPLLVLSQLNRSLEKRPDKRPMMSDLRDSGSIEQDADLITFLYRDEVYNQESEHAGVAELIVAKCRNGAIGTARVSFRGEFVRFDDLSGAQRPHWNGDA